MIENNRILLINNNEDISRYFRDKLIISEGYFVNVESNIQIGLESLKQDGYDIVIVKFGMPDTPGAEIVKALKQTDPRCVIIALYDEIDSQTIKETYGLGVYESITNAIDLQRLFFVIKKGIELHVLITAHHKLCQGFKEQTAALYKQNAILARRVEDSTKNLSRIYEDLRSTYLRTIKVLAHAIDARDHYTHSHSENVAKYAVIIAEELHLSAEQIETIREACELHDLGKIGVADAILSKPSALTVEEWSSIKCHPFIAAQILEPLTFLGSVIDLVKQHHEHYDGTGYPQGFKGETILLGARIIHLADAYEAMRSSRSYRKEPFTKEEAILEIKMHNGTQFDPNVVEAFLKVLDLLP